MEVYDYDKYFKDEFVAKMDASLSVTPASSASTADKHPLTLRGKYVTLDVEIQVFCNKNYFGPSCTTFCKAQDTVGGHFSCDKEGEAQQVA